MIDLSRKQIDAVRSDPALGPEVAASLEDPSLAVKPAGMLTDSEWDDLHDACSNVLFNDAQLAESFEAAQSNGPYLVSILGVPGAYFVTAPEFSPAGAFSTLEEARGCADSDHGEFRVREEEDETEEEEWEEHDPFEPNFPSELLAALGGTADSGVLRKLRERIVSDPTLILLANGTITPDGMASSEEVSDLLADFESSLPKPQGAIAGMARMMSTLPRLSRRVDLFLRLNGRLPDLKETAVLYGIQ
jgi:hypothetical protein